MKTFILLLSILFFSVNAKAANIHDTTIWVWHTNPPDTAIKVWHIRQKNSDTTGTKAYTIVDTKDWQGSLESHPSIVHHPELFEIVYAIIPDDAQYLNYSEE